MKVSHPNISIQIIFLLLISILRRPISNLEPFRSQVIYSKFERINKSWLLFLIDGIHYFQNILAQQFVISVNMNHNRVFAAVCIPCIIIVLDVVLLHVAVEVNVPVFTDVVKLEVFEVNFVTAISGLVVEDDSHIVCVVLLEDGVQVQFSLKVRFVVVWAH